jgi:hypothetical protein
MPAGAADDREAGKHQDEKVVAVLARRPPDGADEAAA